MSIFGSHLGGAVVQIITDLAVMEVGDNGLIVTEVADGVTIDDVAAATGCSFEVASDLKTF